VQRQKCDPPAGDQVLHSSGGERENINTSQGFLIIVKELKAFEAVTSSSNDRVEIGWTGAVLLGQPRGLFKIIDGQMTETHCRSCKAPLTESSRPELSRSSMGVDVA
jgi:hypothetical protein